MNNHNGVVAGCYGGLAVMKLVSGAYPDAVAHAIAAVVHIRAAHTELRDSGRDDR